MPAWMTSLLRELVSVPIAPASSRITTSRPASASARAHARPTTPAPMTTQSTRSMMLLGLVSAWLVEPGIAQGGEEYLRDSAVTRVGCPDAGSKLLVRTGV